MAVLEQPSTRQQLEDAGFVVVASSAQALDDTLSKDLPRYAAVIASAGIKLN